MRFQSPHFKGENKNKLQKLTGIFLGSFFLGFSETFVNT